ncbi:hypothetical protein PG987_009724 [Apiospora arundinis]
MAADGGRSGALFVYQLIRASGRFVDDVSTSYFHGLHLYMPIVSRTRFHDSLVALGAIPSADFSVLLLSMHLVTLDSFVRDREEKNHRPHDSAGSTTIGGLAKPDTQQSLYMTTKSLFAQVQSTIPPSIRLVQAGMLIALYEYTQGEADQAFITISLCARLAYAARLHRSAGRCSDGWDRHGARPEALEASNTWWGIVIWERRRVANVPLRSGAADERGARALLPGRLTHDSLFAQVSDPEILQASHAALKSTTTMVIDVADAHRSSDSAYGLPPTYAYNVQAALDYIRERQLDEGYSELFDVEERLRWSMKL